MKAQLATCFTLAATMLVATTASADKLPDPVTVEIISPEHGAMLEGAPAIIDVELAVSGADLVDNIDLFVDDVAVAQVSADPWTFTDVELAEGMHYLRAVANSGGVGYMSSDVYVAVVAGGETGGEGTGTDGGSGGTSGDGTTSEGGETGSTAGKCSITDTKGTGLLGLGLLGLAVLGLTRRRA
jgi:MYXO-CTERM domain-containing protein